jgi:hypothetical protein
VCRYLGLEPRATNNSLGLRTAIEEIVRSSTARFDDGPDGQAHVLVPVCSEHVVDIYRGRVLGMSMAWQMAAASI